MGTFAPLSHSQLPDRYKDLQIKSTNTGISASVYLLGNRYVLKRFDPDYDTSQEIYLHKCLSHLPIPHIVDSFRLKEGSSVLVYEQAAGSIPYPMQPTHLRQIGDFLNRLHSVSCDRITVPNGTYEPTQLQRLIRQTNTPILTQYLKLTDIPFQRDTIIHADLFPDNSIFADGKLIAVIDWSDFDLGDRRFDLGVVVAGWCFDGAKLDDLLTNALIDGFGDDSITAETLMPWIRYALLYYAVKRYINGRDYIDLLNRLKELI